MNPTFMPNGTGILPRSPVPAGSGGAATGASPAIPGFPPGLTRRAGFRCVTCGR